MMCDSEAADSIASELASFQDLCGKLRSDLERSVQLKKSSTGAFARIALSEGSSALLECKTVNRQVWEIVGDIKARSQVANQAIDNADLKLQNLQYEKNHFLREIRHCRSFTSNERHIDLISTDQCMALAPAAMRSVTQEEDAHQFHVNRLTLEEQQRQELCGKRDALLVQRTALLEENASKRAALEGMAAQVATSPHVDAK